MNFSKILLLIILIIIAIGGAYYYYFYTSQKTSQPISYVASNEETNVLAIDMDEAEDFSQNEIFKGDDAILAINQPSETGAARAYIIQSEKVLALLDRNADGRIDSQDPLYWQLELLFFNKDKNMILDATPLWKAGIRAIFINKRYGEQLNYLPGTVLMADDSSRKIREVSVYLPPQ